MPALHLLELVEPNLAQLPSYADALERGWSPNNVRDVSEEQLQAIRSVPAAFIEANNGRLIGEFVDARHGPNPKLHYLIELDRE